VRREVAAQAEIELKDAELELGVPEVEPTALCGDNIQEVFHKGLVAYIKNVTDCSHGKAMQILGRVCEITQDVHISSYNNGLNAGTAILFSRSTLKAELMELVSTAITGGSHPDAFKEKLESVLDLVCGEE
jgi:hypothetical protein